MHNTKNLTIDYCCCQKCASEKHKNICLKNFGCENACLEQGYNFVFIIDKNYDEFLNQL